jgi:hypothetical protein
MDFCNLIPRNIKADTRVVALRHPALRDTWSS